MARGSDAKARRLLTLERALWKRGLTRIAGVDEAGLGPLAGPVVAAAVILPPQVQIEGADDSKKLSPQVRERCDREIRSCALAVGIGLAEVEEITRYNIRQAGILAMRRALLQLSCEPEQILLDARLVPDLPWPQRSYIRGDARIHCIACASIVAKVRRDQIMREYDTQYPGYGFARHKGYATDAHCRAIRSLGPCPIHRPTFHSEGAQLGLF